LTSATPTLSLAVVVSFALLVLLIDEFVPDELLAVFADDDDDDDDDDDVDGIARTRYGS
jgi:hypothetical protein